MSNRASEILLKDPLLLKSQIIKDPKKLAEGFNRSSNEENKKKLPPITSDAKDPTSGHSLTKKNLNKLRSPSMTNLEALAADRKKLITPLSNSEFTKMSEVDYQNTIDPKLFDQLRSRNVSREVKLEFTKLKLLEKLDNLSSEQEALRKINIDLAQNITKQESKIAACHQQINILTKSLKDLAESSHTKMEETSKIRNVKEKIREVIEHKHQDIQLKQEQIKQNTIKIKQVDLTVDSYQIEIEKFEVKQVEHYYEVLQLGIDTRQEGLKWIVKALWTLGENIKISKLPSYLDAQAINFVFDYSKLDVILSDYLEK